MNVQNGHKNEFITALHRLWSMQCSNTLFKTWLSLQMCPPDGAISKVLKFSYHFTSVWQNYLLFILPFWTLLFLPLWPAKASELQTVHCIVRNVVDILHGCWAEDVHLCLAGFGTWGPLFGCFWTPGLLGRPWTVGPWLPGFSGLRSRRLYHLVLVSLLWQFWNVWIVLQVYNGMCTLP